MAVAPSLVPLQVSQSVRSFVWFSYLLARSLAACLVVWLALVAFCCALIALSHSSLLCSLLPILNFRLFSLPSSVCVVAVTVVCSSLFFSSPLPFPFPFPNPRDEQLSPASQPASQQSISTQSTNQPTQLKAKAKVSRHQQSNNHKPKQATHLHHYRHLPLERERERKSDIVVVVVESCWRHTHTHAQTNAHRGKTC